MATFVSYNSDDGSANNPVLAGNAAVTVGPIMTGIAHRIVGSIFSDQSGSCAIQQSFDGGTYWDISDTFAVTGGSGLKIDLDAIAPMVQIVYTNGSAAQTHFRLFVRVFGVERG